jgi:cytochrome c oxidase subunit 2
MSHLRSLLLRLFFAGLFLLVPVLGVYTFVTASEHGWWFPQNVSSYGGDIDRLFYLILVPVAVTFIGTELVLAWCVFRFGAKRGEKSTYTHGSHRLELLWTAIPALVLLAVAFGQIGPWAEIKFVDRMPHGAGTEEEPFTVEHPLAEVYASQFDWRFRYPDPDGNFQGADVVERPFELVVPVDTKVVVRLKSRDVLHSFFVPEFRLKQDAVPGMGIPVWFEAEEVGEYDLVCAELCGWGHYKMAGKVRVMPREEYDTWIADARAALWTNGSED